MIRGWENIMLKNGKEVKDIKIVQRKMCPIYRLVCPTVRCQFYNEKSEMCYLIELAQKVGK